MYDLDLSGGLLGCGDVENGDQSRAKSAEAEVETFLDSYRVAVEARDTTLLRTMYIDDARFEWLEDGELRYPSPDAILSALAGLPGDFVINTEYDRPRVSPVGTSGANVSMQFQTTMGVGPSSFGFDGVISIVLEKGPTGWRIVGGHTSSSRPNAR